MAIEWDTLWQQLNARQRHFLRKLFQAEQDRASYFHSQRAMFDPLKKGAEWRWLVHNPVGGGGLQDKLDRAAKQAANRNTQNTQNILGDCSPDEKLANNQGSGSTYKALEQYGYLDRRWETVEAYSVAFGSRSVAVLSVRLTARGRKLVKMMLAKAISAETTLNGPAEKPGLAQVRDDLKKKATRRLEKLQHQGRSEVEGLRETEGQLKARGTAYFSSEDWEDLSESSAWTVCASCGLEARVDTLVRVRDRIAGAAFADTCSAFREMVLQRYEERVARPCFLLGKGWLNLRALSQAVRAKRASRAFSDVFQETGLNLVQVDQGWPPVYASEFEHICAWLGASAEAFLVPAPPDAGTLNDRRRGFYAPEDMLAASEN